MKAIVFYHSIYGNTEKVAQAIAAGLKEGGIEDVKISSLKGGDEDDFKDRDLWVIGSPTRWGGASFRLKTLLKNAIKYEGAGRRAAVFDTRFEAMHKGAAQKLKSILERNGIALVVEPEIFKVAGMQGPLAEGEEARAKAYGLSIAAVALKR